MIGAREIEASLKGSWLLFLNREEGLKWFDLSVGGFWRSFLVLVLLLPLFWVTSVAEKQLILTETGLMPEEFQATAFWSARLVGLVLDWLALPVLLAAVARPLGITGTYPAFIAVRNWTSLFVSIPYVLTACLYLAGVMPGGIMYLSWLCLLVMILWFRFQVTRMMLGPSVALALAIVILDFTLSIFIQTAVDRLMPV